MMDDWEEKMVNGAMCWQRKFTSVEEKLSPLHLTNRGIQTNMSERGTCKAL
jgi:hypothetical protein